LVSQNAETVCPNEAFVDKVTAFIVRAEYNHQTMLLANPVMFMAIVKPITINEAMLVNFYATTAVNTAQTHIWW
jgi:hypothetical protein